MKNYRRKLSLYPGLALTAIFGAGLLALTLVGEASATTAANAVIRNTATVTYDDAGGNPQTAATDSVDVTVNLVAVQPELNAPPDTTTPSAVATNYNYTLLNKSNGPETFALSVSYTAGAGTITGHTEVFRNAGDTANITDITLGATSAAAGAASGTAVLTVPNDGSGAGGNTPVNGIAAGDTIVIGTDVYTVASTVDNPTGTSTITLTTNLVANVTIGTQIGERGSFISRTTPTASVNNSTYTLTVSADAASTPATDDTVTTVLLAALNVTKYVQNITSVVACGGGSITRNTGLGAGAIAYCDSGVTGLPGQTLEYVIAVNNPAGGAAATDVIISDPVPAFTTQTGNIALDPGTGTWSNVATTANNGDFAEVVGNTVYIYAGTGGNDNTNAGGSLAANTTTLGAFRVTIDN